jgi:hypothetical protein
VNATLRLPVAEVAALDRTQLARTTHGAPQTQQRSLLPSAGKDRR